MRLDDMPMPISEVTLNLEKFAAQYALSPEMLTLSSSVDDITGMTIIRLVRMVATLPAREHVTVPDGWVQALKDAEIRRSPIMRWLVQRWPIRYRTYEARAYLPDFVVERRGPFKLAVFDFEER